MIPRDKQLHFAAGALIGLSAFLLGWWAMVPVVAAAVGKEVQDKISGKGTPEVLDAVATIAGGLAVTVVCNAISWMKGL